MKVVENRPGTGSTGLAGSWAIVALVLQNYRQLMKLSGILENTCRNNNDQKAIATYAALLV